MVIGIDASRAFVNERTGTEEYSYQLITQMLALPEAQKHNFVLFIRPGAQVAGERSREGVQIVEIKYRYLWTQMGLAASSWQQQLDVLWIPAHTLPVLRRPGLKTVVTIHGLEYKWLPEYQNLLQRWYLPLSTYYAARSATQLIAVSQHTKRELLKVVQIDSKKIKVILEGTEKGKLERRNTKLGTNQKSERKIIEKYGLEEKMYILFIGSLQPRKNLPALIEAFARLTRENYELKLVLAGGKGWQSNKIFQAVTRFNIEDRVVFTGRVEEEVKQVLLTQALVYVQPSVTEGFGLPVLEAMNAGVPVITSDGGALPEVVSGAGMVISLGKGFVDGLAKAMAEMSRNQTLRARLVTAGAKRVRELTWETAARRTLKTLLEV